MTFTCISEMPIDIIMVFMLQIYSTKRFYSGKIFKYFIFSDIVIRICLDSGCSGDHVHLISHKMIDTKNKFYLFELLNFLLREISCLVLNVVESFYLALLNTFLSLQPQYLQRGRYRNLCNYTSITVLIFTFLQ